MFDDLRIEVVPRDTTDQELADTMTKMMNNVVEDMLAGGDIGGLTIQDIINRSDLDQNTKDQITALVEVMKRREPRA